MIFITFIKLQSEKCVYGYILLIYSMKYCGKKLTKWYKENNHMFFLRLMAQLDHYNYVTENIRGHVFITKSFFLHFHK